MSFIHWRLPASKIFTCRCRARLRPGFPAKPANGRSCTMDTDSDVNPTQVSFEAFAGNTCQSQSDDGPPIEALVSALGTPLPRPERRSKRSKSDRGLPADDELARLVIAYLERQRKHWPELVGTELLQERSDDYVKILVEDFKQRHRGMLADFKKSVDLASQFRLIIGGNYNRYSCQNSSPTSIIDQMNNCLDKARAENRFVPWKFVYADFSVTGLDASRQGYSSYKAMLSVSDHLVETTYIDDFTRASRDELEWWKLAALSKRLGKRMIGASDGFDISSPHWDISLTIFGLLSRLFIKSLREKVGRGMKGAARRGTSVGKLPLGFARRHKLDAFGKNVTGGDDSPIFEPCIDPDTSKYRLLMFQFYVEQGWSPLRISRHFNDLKVDGWDGWTATSIRNLLWNPTAIGVFIWNRTRREFDFEDEKWVKVTNPRKDWEVQYFPDRAIVPIVLWAAARRKRAARRRKSPLTGRKPSRNQNSPSTLFSGTLICACCHQELKLARSSGSSKQMGSLNGKGRAKGCRLSTSKSTRIIEECLLGYLRDTLLTDSVVQELVTKSNQFIEEEAAKPSVDIAPKKRRAAQLKVRINRLVTKVSETHDDALIGPYEEQIKRLQRELNDLLAAIRSIDASQNRTYKRIDVDQAKHALSDLRALLQGEAAIAGPIIRELTGEICIRQEPAPGRPNQFRWIATFSPQWSALLQRICPHDTRGIVAAASMSANSVEVIIEHRPRYEQDVVEFRRLRAGGATIGAIAAAYGISWYQVNEALRFGDTGERPTRRPTKKPKGEGTGKGNPPTKYADLAPTVAKLRDLYNWTFRRISKHVGANPITVRRAYDILHPELIREAVERGQSPRRGRSSSLDNSVSDKIASLFAAGTSVKDIAAAVGLSVSTVRRERARIAKRQDEGTDKLEPQPAS